MYYPERNLTLKELTIALNDRLADLDLDMDGSAAIRDDIIGIQNDIEVFTPDILAEDFTRFTFSSHDEFGIKAELRMNAYYYLFYIGVLDIADFVKAADGFIAIFNKAQTIFDENLEFQTTLVADLLIWDVYPAKTALN